MCCNKTRESCGTIKANGFNFEQAFTEPMYIVIYVHTSCLYVLPSHLYTYVCTWRLFSMLLKKWGTVHKSMCQIESAKKKTKNQGAT